MNADLGMAVTLLFWTVTLALASTGRGRGRFARPVETAADAAQACVVYPLVPRTRRSPKPAEDLPQAS
jgi:hypothetical protein